MDTKASSVPFRVGHVHPLWNTLRPQLPADRAAYNYAAGGHTLSYYVTRPTREEVRAFRKGPAKFALLEDGPVLFLLFGFGTALPWSDAPYSIHLVPQERQRLPLLSGEDDKRALLNGALIDRQTGVIRGLRALSGSLGFTRVVHAAIRRQASLLFDPDAYDQAMASAYRKWPSAEAMVRAVAVRTSGGA